MMWTKLMKLTEGEKVTKRHGGRARAMPLLSFLLLAYGTTGAAGTLAAENDFREASGLSGLSIEDLGNIEITSVSKRVERLSDAAASIYVITAEDIRRSGATSIPEILRLAPNLQVARVSASQYAITARGFNATSANKLLVLIDGRSVYTPLFSGVFWDVQDVLPANIERIEVISGPGGTLWGANAVNGVINIISKRTQDTTGTLASVGAGRDERNAAWRYGAKTGEDGENGAYRLYAKRFSRDATQRANGVDVQDSWRKQQAGFRADWRRGGDTFMVNGNAYDGRLDQALYDDAKISGAHVLGRWSQMLADRSSLETQVYYDNTRRNYPGSFAETLDVWNIDIQHRFAWGEKHDIVWGGGYRLSRDDVTNGATFAFLPARRNLMLANVFLQDDIALADNWQLTLGGKLERNNYTGLEFQPNLRLAWKLPSRALLWSALSRSVRTPSRIDADFYAPGMPPFTLLVGNPDFQSEIQTTIEVGYRMQPMQHASFSVSVFYNDYDKLRSSEAGPPLTLANKLKGNTYGTEMWGTYRMNDRWRLSAGYSYLRKNLRTAPDSRDVSSVNAGPDPSYRLSLRSGMDLASNIEFDLALRSIGELPNPKVPGYTAVDARLGWRPVRNLELALTGSNLFDSRHAEFGAASTRSEFERSFHLEATWKF